MQILCVANKQLPDHDYRIKYARYSSVATVRYGLPGRPSSVLMRDYIELGFGEGLSLADFGHFLTLAKHLFESRRQYDLVHFFSTKLQLFGPIVAWLMGVPSISTITGFGRTFNRPDLKYRVLRPIYLALLWISIRFSKTVLFQNRGDMQWLAERLPQLAHKFQWVGSGVDAAIVKSKDFHQEPIKVLMVARLIPDKGVREFLDTTARLAGYGFQFVLAGPKSIGEDELYQEVQLAHQQGRIEYLGELDQDKLEEHYASSHVFLFPSHGEGLPRVMLEAGHALLCPIASDIPAHRDLIPDECGLLFNVQQSTEAMVENLSLMQADRAAIQDFAINYQAHILKGYTVAAYARRMDAILASLFPEAQTSRETNSMAA